MMRILLAHNNYTVQGGAEVFFHEIARVLMARGHEVAMFSAAEDGALDTPYADYFPKVADHKNGGLLSKATRLPKVIYNRDAKAAFARLIADFKPDVVHAFAIYVRLTPSILDAAREAGVPVVLSCNDYKHICANYKLFHHGRTCDDCMGGRFASVLKNRCCHGSTALSAASMIEAMVHDRLDIWRKNVDIFLFASRFMAQKTEEFWGKDRVQIDFLRNPFDARKYHVPAHVGDYFLYFGRLIDEKGVDVLIEAARLRPEARVVVVGDGPDLAKLETQAASIDNVDVVGPAWGDELAKWLHGARAVIVPSVWHENFPYVILQAFAASTPVIGAHRGGIPELIEAGDHGWTYEATDPDALASCMGDVLFLPDARLAKMGAAAAQYTRREFSDDKLYAALMKIYQRVVT